MVVQHLHTDEFITGNRVQLISDSIFSKVILDTEVNNEVLQDYFILNNSKKNSKSNTKLIIKKQIYFHDGVTIFTHSDLLMELFYKVSKSTAENINVISHMSDKKFDQKLFNKIPSQISKVYTVNLNINKSNLINIPLGLGNHFSKKNLQVLNFSNLTNEKFFKNKIDMYLNFNLNTNYSVRSKAFRLYKDKDWVKVGGMDLSLRTYKKNLENSTFVLCPPGNGPDTHRVWEALYSGSIPIVLNSPTFKGYDNLPILKLNSLNKISHELLSDYLLNLENKDISFEKISLNYWKNEVKHNQKKQNIYDLNYSKSELLDINKKLSRKSKLEKIKKLLHTYQRKFIKFVNLIMDKI